MRLDQYLFVSGLTVSRAKAKEMITNGSVKVGDCVVTKPAYEIKPSDFVLITENPLQRYVGRGGLKLEAALEAFGVSPAGRICADIGASSGGFTDCLLRHGASFVYAVDSGEGQLHSSLLQDARVCSMEKTNARYLSTDSFDRTVSLAVMDVSFISQTLLFPAVSAFLQEGGELISLVKPQFEVGRSAIGKKGIVKDQKIRKQALQSVLDVAGSYGLLPQATVDSPIVGGDGNMEYLAYFIKQSVKEGSGI